MITEQLENSDQRGWQQTVVLYSRLITEGVMTTCC